MKRSLCFTTVIIGLLLSCALAFQAQTTFTNPVPITINDASTATPYPSDITVATPGTAIAATPTAVAVKINGFSHTFPDDVGIVLVGPTGAALLLQDGAGDDPDMVNVTYTLVDSAAANLPGTTAWTAGAYKPTSYFSGDAFPAPGPGTAYNLPGPVAGGSATFQSTFAGTNPNGVWHLYVVDFVGGDFGSISGGWSLIITTTASAADATVSGRVTTPNGRGLTGVSVVLSDNHGNSRVVQSGVKGLFSFTEVATGESYLLTVKSRLYRYAPVVIVVNDSLSDIELHPEE